MQAFAPWSHGLAVARQPCRSTGPHAWRGLPFNGGDTGLSIAPFEIVVIHVRRWTRTAELPADIRRHPRTLNTVRRPPPAATYPSRRSMKNPAEAGFLELELSLSRYLQNCIRVT